MDFTIETYRTMINALIKQGFSFQSFAEFIEKKKKRAIILRHDVDLLPENSLKFARIQSEKGIRGTYYFRIVPESFDEKIIKEIYELGHEIGYHYEDVSLVASRQKAEGGGREAGGKGHRTKDARHKEEEIVKIAIESFKKNLEKLRKIVPVTTICMHGSPMSRWDSRLLWKYYNYHDFGIVREPYFDVNFDEVLYLTDTGRRWDGDSYNIRDKAKGGRRKALGGERERGRSREGEKGRWGDGETENPAPSTQHPVPFHKFHSTFDIITAAEKGELPDKIMMTFHPQRWTSHPIPWIRELIWQNTKNVVKYYVVKLRSE